PLLTLAALRAGATPPNPPTVAGHVQDHGYVVLSVAQALAEDPAPGHLEHGEVHPRVLEHHLRRLRPARVNPLDQTLVDVDAVGGRHPDLPPHPPEDVRDHPDRGALPVRA